MPSLSGADKARLVHDAMIWLDQKGAGVHPTLRITYLKRDLYAYLQLQNYGFDHIPSALWTAIRDEVPVRWPGFALVDVTLVARSGNRYSEGTWLVTCESRMTTGHNIMDREAIVIRLINSFSVHEVAINGQQKTFVSEANGIIQRWLLDETSNPIHRVFQLLGQAIAKQYRPRNRHQCQQDVANASHGAFDRATESELTDIIYQASQ